MTSSPATSLPAASPPAKPWKRWLMLFVKLALAAAILWWVKGTLVDGWRELTQRDEGHWHWQPGWLVVAGIIYLAGLLPFALFWFRVLRVLGQRPTLRETLRAYYIGHLGKYVPGKAMVVVMRTALIRSDRVATGMAAVSVFVETLTMMAVGAFAAAVYLLLFFRQEMMWSVAAALLMVVSVTPTIPPVFRRLARFARVGRANPETLARLDSLGFRTLAVGWAMALLGWILLGLSYWATLRAMGLDGLDPLGHLPRYVAGVALAVVAGFLLLILPGGVGVREAFLARLMVPYLQDLGQPGAAATAWASAFLLRLVWTVSELLISGILYVLKPRSLRPGDDSGAPTPVGS